MEDLEVQENSKAIQADNNIKIQIIKKYYKYISVDFLLLILSDYGLKSSKFEVESIISSLRYQSIENTKVSANSNIISFRANSILNNAKSRAKKKQLNFDIDIQWLRDKLDKGRCEVTGLKFKYKKYDDSKTSPYAPSLDRINPKKGYTKDNTQVVITNYNKFKSNHHTKHTIKIAKAILKHKV